jgi:hypothetical protein
MSLDGVYQIAQHNVKAVRENRKRFIHVLRWAVRNFRGYFNADSDSDGFPVNTEQIIGFALFHRHLANGDPGTSRKVDSSITPESANRIAEAACRFAVALSVPSHLDLQLWGRAEPNSSWASQFTGLAFVLVSDIGFLHSASLDR